MTDDLMTREEAADFLGVSLVTFDRWSGVEGFPVLRKQALEEWLQGMAEEARRQARDS